MSTIRSTKKYIGGGVELTASHCEWRQKKKFTKEMNMNILAAFNSQSHVHGALVVFAGSQYA
jgi:hypothetical protein